MKSAKQVGGTINKHEWRFFISHLGYSSMAWLLCNAQIIANRVQL